MPLGGKGGSQIPTSEAFKGQVFISQGKSRKELPLTSLFFHALPFQSPIRRLHSSAAPLHTFCSPVRGPTLVSFTSNAAPNIHQQESCSDWAVTLSCNRQKLISHLNHRGNLHRQEVQGETNSRNSWIQGFRQCLQKSSAISQLCHFWSQFHFKMQSPYVLAKRITGSSTLTLSFQLVVQIQIPGPTLVDLV